MHIYIVRKKETEKTSNNHQIIPYIIKDESL